MTAADAEVRAHFRGQAQSCARMGSPFTAGLLTMLSNRLGRSTRTGQAVLGWPGDPTADALALRLAGALHALVLSEADVVLASVYPPREAGEEDLRQAVMASIERHDDRLVTWLNSAPQTNEVARSAALFPALQTLSRETKVPLALYEIGSSAGLNLCLDRFAYIANGRTWGETDSPVRLSPEWRGRPPDLSNSIEIAKRNGVDRFPIDARSKEGQLRLQSYVWPDQPQRLERLQGAIGLFLQSDILVEKGEADQWVPAVLSNRPAGCASVVMHSVVWQYLAQKAKDTIIDALERSGAAATPSNPLAWLRMEGLGGMEGFARLELTLWPGGRTRLLAKVDFHGRWIEWQ